METLMVILILIVLVMLWLQKTALSDQIGELRRDILNLQGQVTKLVQKPVETMKPPLVSGERKTFVQSEPPQPIVSDVSQEKVTEVIQKPSTPEKVIVPPPQKQREVPPRVQPRMSIEQESEPATSFFGRHPDLEKFIGENLVNKIGIAILVLSIGYFVKYAIDSNWIGEVGRVSIGILAGAILIGFAHRMRESYKAFSSVLVGGGLAVFYFTIALAFHQFNLFSQLVGLIIMIVITLFAVILSLLYDKQELAVIALIGGFSSPFMLSTGHANYNGLFLYLLILNIGLLVIAYRKSWRILNTVCFGLTVIVFSGVLYMLSKPTYHLAFIYGSIFYLLYFFINIAYNVRENKTFIASDFSILLINTGLYFSAGLYLLTVMEVEIYRGAFSAALALINLILSYVLFKNRKVDTNILYLLIGITLTFISLTAPIQLKGNHITLFWASEAVLLYWLFQKSKIELMRLTSQIIWVAMLISLLMDWQIVYGTNQTHPVIINRAFITSVVAVISTFLLAYFKNKDEAEDRTGFQIPQEALRISALILLFLAGLLEVNHQFSIRYAGTGLNVLYLMLYVPAFVLGLIIVSDKFKKTALADQPKAILIAVTLLIYLLCEPQFNYLQYEILDLHKVAKLHFIAHWTSAGLIGLLLYRLIRLCIEILEVDSLNKVIWLLCGAAVLFLSLEVNLLSNFLFFSAKNSIESIQQVYIKTGLPVLWGLSSFAIMWLGMNNKNKTLRIISLTLFSITLAKLFLYDIRNIPAAGKIAAFFCLGVLLLIVSFMYQKLKKIITDESPVD